MNDPLLDTVDETEPKDTIPRVRTGPTPRLVSDGASNQEEGDNMPNTKTKTNNNKAREEMRIKLEKSAREARAAAKARAKRKIVKFIFSRSKP